jgi:hypothetical protein
MEPQEPNRLKTSRASGGIAAKNIYEKLVEIL